MAEQEILRDVASFDVHRSAFMKNVVVESQKRCCRCTIQNRVRADWVL